ncbi:50S ribosomal protein L25 [Patescibacteria group bacterium]|nr:50S ribosomal protein L25 [Patescibacteria group bacterium]
MEKTVLKAEKRDKKGRAVRHHGLIPAVIYGKGKANENLSVETGNFERALKSAGTSSIIDVDVSGDIKKALIQEVVTHPVTSKILHVDFYEVSMKEKITTSVPLKIVGESAAVIDKNGSLMTNKNEIEIECLPADLPHEIEVDISVLDDFDKAIHVSDLKISDKIEIKDDLEEMIVTAEPPRSEEELAELEEPVSEAEMPESEHGDEDKTQAEGAESTESDNKDNE